MNITKVLTQYVVDTNWDTLPCDAIEPTKRQILDTLGVAVAGASQKKFEPLVNLLRGWGGKEESTILGYGGKVPCINAALINGFLAATLDFSDYSDQEYIHVCQENIPACFAMAERKGAVNGEDFMVAVALSYDIANRLSRATTLHHEKGFPWDCTVVFGYFGCAAAAGKLLGLNQEQLNNALAIVLQFANGIEYPAYGITTKGLLAGRAGAGGIFAALLAEMGFTGISDPIEGKFGVYDTFYSGVYLPAVITLDLGKTSTASKSGFKPYPFCSYNNAITATLALVTEKNIKPEDVIEVMTEVGPRTHYMFEPRELKIKPPNPVAASFSLPWALSYAIIHRQVGIEAFTEEAIKETNALELAQRIHYKINMEHRLSSDDNEPATVHIKTKKGETYSKHVEIRYGHYLDPMDFNAIAEKFKYCCGFSPKPIPKANQDKVVEMVKELESVSDVSEIMLLLA